jgi:protein-disulfide isomerase
MRIFHIALVGALAGAIVTVPVVFAVAGVGLLPLNGPLVRNYLLEHPQLVGEMSERLQKLQQDQKKLAQRDAMKKIGLAAFFDPKIAFTFGPANSKKSLVEFYDYNCPYCRASLPAMMRFVAMHAKDTRISFIEFPIKGVNSTVAARFALAARNQPVRFLALHFALMGEQTMVTEDTLLTDARRAGLDLTRLRSDMERPDIAKTLEASRELARKAGVDGTPTFIVNGVIHPGAVDDETLDSLINDSVTRNGASKPAG